jgi:hypothetical protein
MQNDPKHPEKIINFLPLFWAWYGKIRFLPPLGLRCLCLSIRYIYGEYDNGKGDKETVRKK